MLVKLSSIYVDGLVQAASNPLRLLLLYSFTAKIQRVNNYISQIPLQLEYGYKLAPVNEMPLKQIWKADMRQRTSSFFLLLLLLARMTLNFLFQDLVPGCPEAL